MPNLDGTGPNGKGPVTGRGLGNCSDAPVNNNSQPGFRRPWGRGFNCRWFWSKNNSDNANQSEPKDNNK